LTKAATSALAASRRKLALLGLTEEQVAGIEKLDKAPLTVTIVSPIHGHISEKRVIEGGAVKSGDELMQISDQSTMWLIVQVFEQQLGSVHVGQKVTAAVDAVPGKEFAGTVDFVYPHLDPSTRTAQVRVLIPNADHTLHQNMFAEARIEEDAAQPSVLVPREAILDTGQRQMLFVALGNGHFAPRDVKVGRTGTVADDATRYVEVTGITENDTIVTSGQFLLDSESRLEEARKKFATPGASGVPVKPVTPGMEGMPGM
jgi:RND family efflux transporter MFP subunit